MGLFNVFDISASALTAQSVRLSAISSNLANAEVVSGSAETAYRAQYPVFSAVIEDVFNPQAVPGVKVTDMVKSSLEPRKEFSPDHPLADQDGYIYFSNVNSVEETANMISASRSYQSSVEVMNASKQLIMRTINLGR